MNEENPAIDDKPKKKKTNIGALVKSILAAAIGVQSNKNRERDFEEGNPLAFIIGGFIFTALFIGTIATIVGFVLSTNR
ncbi:DUF2970 domain-containing protein [SAR92 clade bacterium H455]|uniref:DUF2970 domain-containing protein n=1 Tax=SAR92 clade bacterium H455 TaxID=2974818 RepID=A0ABY5TMV9_9GAMM|nr:DUF2970 domain-containing protein [SAR92 clade bacterium H455]